MTSELPKTVLDALGPEAARDFVAWFEQQFGTGELSSAVQISAFVARQKVNVLMLEQVSNQLLANEPVLVQTSDGGWLWRVPVDLTFSSRGRVGRVGEIEVDARYGEVRYSEDLLAQIASQAQKLAQETHPSTT
ncbi:hypothetical protein ACFLXQ_00565 [Chloroflexota bacterium]